MIGEDGFVRGLRERVGGLGRMEGLIGVGGMGGGIVWARGGRGKGGGGGMGGFDRRCGGKETIVW